MKKSDLKILIKKVQNECALEEPTHITYYWNEDHKLVFKLFFDSLIIPEELMVDEDNISKCFSEQNVYEFEDDFVIKELNREKGYIEVIPDDQKFKVINSYKDYNEDEKDVKNESIVHLAGEHISETFAKTKGFILREGEQGPDAPAKSSSVKMIAVAFTMYALNDGNKQYLGDVIRNLGLMLNKDTSKGPVLDIPKGYVLKIFINLPQNSQQLAGIEDAMNLGDFLVANYGNIAWDKTCFILSTDKAKQMAKVADPSTSIFCSLGPDMLGAINDCGLSSFKNEPKALKDKIENYLNDKVAPAYEKFLKLSKKDYESALNKANLLIQRFLKEYEVTSSEPGAVAKKFEQSPYWKPAVEKFNGIKDKTPPDPDWRIMQYVATTFSFGQSAKDLPDETGYLAEYKKQVHKTWNDIQVNFSSWSTTGNTILKEFTSLPKKGLDFVNAKTADASKETGGIWQDTEMAKGKSSAGVDFTDKEKQAKQKGNIINYMYYLNIYTFFNSNNSDRASIGKCILLTNPVIPKKTDNNGGDNPPKKDKPKKEPKKDK